MRQQEQQPSTSSTPTCSSQAARRAYGLAAAACDSGRHSSSVLTSTELGSATAVAAASEA
eukprot:7229658-Alexandrium_andersonii.AAC.1